MKTTEELQPEENLENVESVRPEIKIEDIQDWHQLFSKKNPLEASLLAIAEVPFRRTLLMTEVGLPDPIIYRLYKK